MTMRQDKSPTSLSEKIVLIGKKISKVAQILSGAAVLLYGATIILFADYNQWIGVTFVVVGGLALVRSLSEVLDDTNEAR